jgi:hypothetical protein
MTKQKKTTAGGNIESIRWREGFRPIADVSAEEIYNEIKTIGSGVERTAEQVFEWAESHPESKVHAAISNWDDAADARQYRVERVRLLMRSIIVVFKEAPHTPTRAFQVDASRWKRADGYKPYRDTSDILGDPEARAALLQRALNQLISVRRQFSALQELSIVFRAIDEVLETIKP